GRRGFELQTRRRYERRKDARHRPPVLRQGDRRVLDDPRRRHRGPLPGRRLQLDASNATVSNTSCTAASPCVLRDYVPSNWTPAADHQPIINTGANNNSFTLNNTKGQHQEGFRIINLDFEGGGNANSTAILVIQDISDVFICNVTINGTDGGI